MQRISLVDNSCDILPLHGDETCHFVTDGAEPCVRSRGKSDEREREMSFEELPYFMTPKQLADVTGEHEGSITRGIREGRIPADKVNGRWRICRDVIFKNAKKGASNDGEGRE